MFKKSNETFKALLNLGKCLYEKDSMGRLDLPTNKLCHNTFFSNVNPANNRQSWHKLVLRLTIRKYKRPLYRLSWRGHVEQNKFFDVEMHWSFTKPFIDIYRANLSGYGPNLHALVHLWPEFAFKVLPLHF